VELARLYATDRDSWVSVRHSNEHDATASADGPDTAINCRWGDVDAAGL
jgi:hypothetical protein